MVHTFSVFVVVLSALISVSTANKTPTLSWFSTRSHIRDYTNVDFRGCYGPECVYVAAEPIPNFPSKNLGLYSPAEKLWAVASSGEARIEYIFSPERPKEHAYSLWVTPVASHRVRPAVFNATQFLPSTKQGDVHVAEFLSRISQANIQAMVERLSAYNSRNSMSPDTVAAANWVVAHMTQLGCENAHTENFRAGWAPNVICQISGTDPNADPVVIGAHYDSRSTNVNSPTQRAPGADDNGSGSAAILEILQVATTLIREEGFAFESTLIFALFAGEEQGLVGSAALATQYYNAGLELTAMVNLDMIGYPDSAFPQTIYWMSGSTTSALTQLAFELTRTYLPNPTLATTSACCSDQQSFYSRGYPAASIFESRSAFNNPNYHQSSDLPSTVNFAHVLRNTRSAAALITTLAGITGPL